MQALGADRPRDKTLDTPDPGHYIIPRSAKVALLAMIQRTTLRNARQCIDSAQPTPKKMCSTDFGHLEIV